MRNLILLITALTMGFVNAQDDKYITPDKGDLKVITYDSSKGFAMSGYYGFGDVPQGGAGFEYFTGAFSIGAKYIGGNNWNLDTDYQYVNTIAATFGVKISDNLVLKASGGSTNVEDSFAYDYHNPKDDEQYTVSYFDVGLQLFIPAGDTGAFIPEFFIGTQGAGLGIGFKF